MRLMRASQVAASAWMNPARWADAPPTAVPADAAPATWIRDHYMVTLATGPAQTAVAERAREAVLCYRIFAPRRLIAGMPNMTVMPGDTIVQGIRIGPLGLIAAVRVVHVFDRDRDDIRRTGFSYVTLAGHPERGAMAFAVVEDRRAGEVRLEIDVVSQPGHWLTRLLRPLTRRLQRAFTREALNNVAALADGMPGGETGAR